MREQLFWVVKLRIYFNTIFEKESMLTNSCIEYVHDPHNKLSETVTYENLQETHKNVKLSK